MSMKLFNTRTHAHTTHALAHTHSHKAASCPPTLSSASLTQCSSSVLNVNKSWALLEKRWWVHAEDRVLLQELWALPGSFSREAVRIPKTAPWSALRGGQVLSSSSPLPLVSLSCPTHFLLAPLCRWEACV